MGIVGRREGPDFDKGRSSRFRYVVYFLLLGGVRKEEEGEGGRRRREKEREWRR
jgi:hypothetical protein